MNRIRGWIHEHVLIPISNQYARFYRHQAIDIGIYPLPFNLVLKFTTGTREEEGISMSLAHTIGVPVPRFISYGDHGSRYTWGSILMTRIPGQALSEVFESLSESELTTIRLELDGILGLMRSYRNPRGTRICGILGGDFYGARVPLGHLPPCNDETALYKSLLKFASSDVGERQIQVLDTAKRMLSLPTHPIVFTHGDLWHHNIMVHNGHISGIIDWECAGWLPTYWEFTSIMRWRGSPWSKFLSTLPQYDYDAELESEVALVKLTEDSFRY
jgi:hypothetical protein